MSFLPWVLVGPFSGVLVDRRDRRTLMLVGQLVRSISVATLAVSVSGGWASVGLLYVVAIAVAAGETVVDSASQAAVPHLVDDEFLDRANGQMTVAENLFNHVIGIGLGAMLYSLDPSVPFYVNATTFVAGAALLTRVRRPLQGLRTDTSTTSVRADIFEGLRFLLGHRFLRPLAFSVAATNLAVNIGFGVMVVLVIDEIGSTEATFGSILAIGSLGGVVGAAVAGSLVTRLTPQRTLKLTHLPFLVAAIIFTVATDAWMVSLSFVLSSFAVVLFQVPSRSMRQRVTPDHLLGRVVAAFRLFGLGGPVAGAPLGGVITHTLSVRWAFATSGVVLILAWALAVRSARSYDLTQPNMAEGP